MKNPFLSELQLRLKALTQRRITIILCVVGFLAYANAIPHPFVHDDVVFIQQNPHIADLNLKNIFWQTIPQHGQLGFINNYYRPLLEFFNRLQYQIFHLNPYGYHLTNVVIHLINGLLVYQLVYLLRKRRALLFKDAAWISEDGWDKGFALTAALLFLVHPAQSEAVACISGISNLLNTLLSFGVLYLYLTSFGDDKKRNLTRYAWSLVLYFLSLLSKEQSAILPLIIVLCEWALPARGQNQSSKALKLSGYFLIVGFYFLMRQAILGHFLTPPLDSPAEMQLRLLALPRIFFTYLGILFVPHDLHYYRCLDFLKPYIFSLVFFSLFIIVIGLLIKLIAPARRRLLFFGLGWFLIALLPVLNIFPLVNEYSLLLTAEHFLYFAIVGMIIFILSLGESWIESVRKMEAVYIVSMILVSVLVTFFLMTIKQNTYWRGEIPLFKRTIKYERNFGRARILLAKAYARSGQYEEAIRQYGWAYDIMKKYADKVKDEKIKAFYLDYIKEIYLDLAHCHEAMGDFEATAKYYLKVIQIDPQNSFLYSNLGLNYLKINNINKALGAFEKAVALNDNDLMAKNSLAICYKEVGRLEEAQELLREIVERDPQSASAKQNLENLISPSNLSNETP